MKKLAKKVLAICLSIVMAGTMLSAVAFAAEPETVSDDEYGIETLDSFTVINQSGYRANWSFSGDVYIEKGVSLTLSGACSISGDVYVFGTLVNKGTLTITGTLHCLNYTIGSIYGGAGNYNYGYFIDEGQASMEGLDAKDGWLEDTVIPQITDDSESEGTHVTVISGDETFTDREITGDVVISKDTTLTTSGDVSITGDVYVLGTLINEGWLDITGVLYCLNYYDTSAGDYDGDYDNGCVYNEYVIKTQYFAIDDSYLSLDLPTSTVHVWGEIEWTLDEDGTSGTATRTCLVCGETETVDVDVSEETIETEDGKTETEVTLTADFGDEEEGDGDEDEVVTVSLVEDTENEDEDTTEDNDNTSTGTTGTGSTGTGSSGNSGTSGSSGTGSTVTSPQTSDFTNTTVLWLIVACFGLAGCVALVVYKVRGTKEQD